MTNMRLRTALKPCVLNLKTLGWIEGVTIQDAGSGKTLCHRFGGVPYAQPPLGPYRWRRPRPLPAGYQYGTRVRPGRFTGVTGICPQYAPHAQPDPAWVTEDCLQANIWLPPGAAPAHGWPVYFYIHGGSLQYGSPNELNYTEMLGDTNLQAVIVTPAYRLNALGFLASKELQDEASQNGDTTLGNFGFWDQRLCLEWTHRHIRSFGGDPSNMTVAGYSAGAHSVFYQLAYDLGRPATESLIRRVAMHSNACGMQPKCPAEAQHQFDELATTALGRSPARPALPAPGTMARLRAIRAPDIIAATQRMSLHEFRSVSDGAFVRPTLFRELEDGSLARTLVERDIRIWIGDCRDEHFLYRTFRPPRDDTWAAFRARLLAEYPADGVEALLRLYVPDGRLPPPWSSWRRDAFGHVWADIQVHMLQRGLIACLARGGVGDLVHRYRVEWRAKETDASLPKQWGATHWADNSIWVYGEGRGLEPREKTIVKAAFLDLYAKFVHGEDIRSEWGTTNPRELRRLKADGSVDIWPDEMWDRGLEVWAALRNVGAGQSG